MARNTALLVAILAVIVSIAHSKGLPDCDEFIDEAPLSVDETNEECHKECSEDKDGECFKKCLVKKVEKDGEEGEYFKFIVSNLNAKKTETWKQELADILKEKCLPLLTEQKKIAETFDCYMEHTKGKCVEFAPQ